VSLNLADAPGVTFDPSTADGDCAALTADASASRSLLVDRVTDILLVLDSGHRIADANLAALRFAGVPSVHDLRGTEVTHLLPTVTLDLQAPEQAPLTASREVANVEAQRADGSTSYLNITISWSDDRSLVFLVIEDASDEMRRLAEMTVRIAALTQMAFTDVLTQLPNRLAYEDHLAQREPQSEPGWLVMFDVDEFKMINDTLGHPGGDLLLSKVAERLQNAVRRRDFLARIGGDEFALFLPSRLQQNEVYGRLRYLQSRLAPKYEFEGTTFRSTCSFGAAWCGSWMTTPEWIRQTDRALYESKARGKGSVTVHKKPALAPVGAAN